MNHIIHIENGVPRHPLFRMKEPVNLSMGKGEQLAIVGPNGAGKSLLVDIITGRWPLLMNEVKYDFSPSDSTSVYDNVKYITFRDTFGDSDANLYYQQRWNSQDSEISPVVRDLLPSNTKNDAFEEKLYELFGIYDMLDKYIVSLSSGEMRKFQLVKTLLSNPRLLIVDNPFIGLDMQTRDLLKKLFRQLIESLSLQLILVLSKANDIPDFITHVVPVVDRVCGIKQTRTEYQSNHQPVLTKVLPDEKRQKILNLPDSEEHLLPEIVKLQDVCIHYGNRNILKNLNWEIKKGEKWALSGENGAGKSTLLSLICADNPQSYTCNITLFGKKRGTGESIWDIKKHIGYVSPEMFRSYQKSMSVTEIVASGLFDTIGLYRRPNPTQIAVCEWWMDIFGITFLKDRNFLQLSSGEQRMVLLVRAFVKDPDLLILDEPLHGLDEYYGRLVKDVIETFCRRKDKTLIMVTHYKEELPSCITHSLHIKRN